MAVVKFGVGDSVRFIGTDNPVTVRQYNPETQRGDDLASSQWASKIYLELTEPARRAGSGNELLHH
jgi:hypothetical protein